MPDPVADLLAKAPISQAQKAAMWDVFQQTADADELAAKLKAAPIPQTIKADLWDLKTHGAQPTPSKTGDTYTGPDTFMGGALQSLKETASKTLAGVTQGAAAALNPINIVRGPYELGKDLLTNRGANTLATIKAVASGNPEAGGQAIGGLLTGALLGEVVPKRVGVPGVGVTRNAEEAAAVKFGQEAGIPVDAATVTGNRAVRALQHVSDRSLAGSVVAEKAQQAQAAGLTKTGEALAERVHPEVVTPEQAGAGVSGALNGLMRDLHGQANAAYGKLRSIEAETPVEVAKPVEITSAMQGRMRNTLGKDVPTSAEFGELRRMSEEMKALGYQAGKLVDEEPGMASGSHYVPRSAGAPVYMDILQAAGVTSPRAKVVQSIDSAVQTGSFNRVARGALEVARKRVTRSSTVTKPMLPPDAGAVTESMLLPVDVREVKAATQPLYQQLKRESELVPLHGGKAQVLVALDRLQNGPDHAPLSIADSALSDLKAMARSDDPTMRSAAQGRAAFAVKNLDAAVKTAATKAGPEAIGALEEGRAATAAKYATAAVRDTINEEPVKAFRQMTAPKDSAIGQLRQVAEYAPAEMPKIGRAVLEDLLGKATEVSGKFEHTAKIYADWQKLGPQTKRMLFGETVPDLDKFFLLAKRMGETPNPSGTAHTLAVAGQTAELVYNPLAGIATQLGAAGLSTLLHSPRGVKLLTRGLTLQLAKAPKAVQAGAWSDVLTAAHDAGAMTPATADQDQSAVGAR